MVRGFIFAASLVAGAVSALAFLPGAQAPAGAQKPDETLGQCPEKLVGRASLLCACPSEATATGSVWGADIYTDDSAICRAALHAGAIGTGGGTVWVVEAPGQASYPAVTRNSVAGNSWATWGRSIAFRPPAEADAAARRPPGLAACPANAAGRDLGERLRCACTAEAAAAGSVWGTGPYTGDSTICRAAVHAGAIRVRGGDVTVRIVAGRAGYPAGRRNGVDANSWGSYATSFTVGR